MRTNNREKAKRRSSNWARSFTPNIPEDGVCLAPFTRLIVTRQAYRICCPGWQPLGRSGSQGIASSSIPPMQAWNSKRAQSVRSSIIDGSYRFCRTCPALHDIACGSCIVPLDQVTDEYVRNAIKNKQTALDRPPTILHLSGDRTCNLQCPSCRTRRVMQPHGFPREKQVVDTLIGAHTQRIGLAGAGDPFASLFYRDFLTTYDFSKSPNAHITLATNGLLLPRYWDRIANDRVDLISVSVDAASPLIYEQLRYPGKWPDILKALNFIGDLRRRGKLKTFMINLVVQQRNWRDMPGFVTLGLNVGANVIKFMPIVPRGERVRDYAHAAIQMPEHPENAEFVEMLQDPIFRRDAITIHLGPLRHLIRGAAPDTVDLPQEMLI